MIIITQQLSNSSAANAMTNHQIHSIAPFESLPLTTSSSFACSSSVVCHGHPVILTRCPLPILGIKVGGFEGSAIVGGCVAFSLIKIGTGVGEFVGFGVGEFVGFAVGADEGEGVVGLGSGDDVGLIVGMMVGVDNTVGLRVGTGSANKISNDKHAIRNALTEDIVQVQ